MTANIFIYGGLGVMLLGAVYGLLVAIKGYRMTDWKNVRRISYWGDFQFGQKTPVMKRHIRAWSILMIIGFIFTGVGIYLLQD